MVACYYVYVRLDGAIDNFEAIQSGKITVETALQQAIPEFADEDELEQQAPAPVPSDKTPQEFYAEVTQRADVRLILAELATG